MFLWQFQRITFFITQRVGEWIGIYLTSKEVILFFVIKNLPIINK